MISMDKKYRTRDGRDVRLLCVDGPDRKYPVVGVVSEALEEWTLDGGYGITRAEHYLDLIEYHEPDIRTIWVNVYEGVCDSYNTEEGARYTRIPGATPIAIAQPVTFEVKK